VNLEKLDEMNVSRGMYNKQIFWSGAIGSGVEMSPLIGDIMCKQIFSEPEIFINPKL